MNLVASTSSARRATATVPWQWLLDPIDAWSNLRLAVTGVIAGLLVFLGAAVLWQMSDLSGTDSARAALHDAQQRLSRAQAMVAKLPALRAGSSIQPAASQWTAADALRDTTAQAAQSGLRIGTIEPATRKGEGLATELPLHFRAEGSFAGIQHFFAALDDLPRLVIPADVQLKVGAGALTMDATLRVFIDLPPVARPFPHPFTSARGIVASDPFGAMSGATPGDLAATQLVGTFRDRRHALALLQTADGVAGFAPGVMIGGERLGAIRSASVDLTRRDGVMRTIALPEDRP